MKPIYKPKARAKEYGDLAINIYTGCPHRCYYCFAPSVLHKEREVFHSIIEPRKGIVEAVKKQIDSENIKGKLIHLCFTCDPYPKNCNTTPTREIIKIIKETGNHVQILTKGTALAMRDFDLLDSNDWFGITYAGYDTLGHSPYEPNAGTIGIRKMILAKAKEKGISTWVSCEPVLNADDVLDFIKNADYIDKFKIGKLNYHPSDINWGEFGRECERLCKEYKRNYYIKDDLRLAMLQEVSNGQS